MTGAGGHADQGQRAGYGRIDEEKVVASASKTVNYKHVFLDCIVQYAIEIGN